MMAAVQPFLSGAISKTVNMPREATVDGHSRGVPGGVAAGPEGAGDLPGRVEGEPAGRHVERVGPGEGAKRAEVAELASKAAATSPALSAEDVSGGTGGDHLAGASAEAGAVAGHAA